MSHDLYPISCHKLSLLLGTLPLEHTLWTVCKIINSLGPSSKQTKSALLSTVFGHFPQDISPGLFPPDE